MPGILIMSMTILGMLLFAVPSFSQEIVMGLPQIAGPLPASLGSVVAPMSTSASPEQIQKLKENLQQQRSPERGDENIKGETGGTEFSTLPPEKGLSSFEAYRSLREENE